METVRITKGKEHIIATDAVIGETLQTGLDIRLSIYQVIGNLPNIDETAIITNVQMVESTSKAGVYQYPWVPAAKGNYRIDIWESTGTVELSTDYGLINVKDTDTDDLANVTNELYVDLGVQQNFEQGDTVTLEILVYDTQGGSLVNADAIPTVAIVNAIGVTEANGVATQISTGRYQMSYKLAKGSRTGSWYFYWTLTVGSVAPREEYRKQFFVVVNQSCVVGSDQREGYAFENPNPGNCDGIDFGDIITPDELRYVYLFGNELVAPNGQTITDGTLQWYIDNAIANVERDLNFQIKYKKIFHDDIQFNDPRDLVAEGKVGPTDIEGVDYFRESPYDFNGKEFREYVWLKLKKRPLITITKAKFVDLTGKEILDLLVFGMKMNKEKASVEFFPNTGSLASLALISSNSVIFNNVLEARGKYPDGFYLDYEVGYKCAAQVRAQHSELFPIIGKLAAVSLLASYGDGRSPGLASSSISLAGISESFATTQSATNALFGARILQYTKELKEFYKENKNKYAGVLFTAI